MEPSHFWSQCHLVNGVRSWQLIIKHDLTHRFHGRTLGVRPSVRFPHRSMHRCVTSPVLEPGSTCERCQKLAIDYKIMISHIVSMAGNLVSVPVSGFNIGEGTGVEPSHFWSQGPLVNGVKTWHILKGTDV